MNLQAYVILEILYNPWIWSKIFRIWKCPNIVFPYSVHSAVNLPAWRLKETNITLMPFLRLFADTITPERKGLFSKLFHKCCQSWRHPWGTINIPFCDVITQIGTCFFVTSCWNINLVSMIRNSTRRSKKHIQIYFIFMF